MADCFWTDFVGCSEECGGAPSELLNALNTFDLGFDPLAGTLADAYGDLATVQTAAYNGDPWNDSSPSFTFAAPLRLADRGGVFSYTEVYLLVALDGLTTPDAGYSWGGNNAAATVDVGGALHDTRSWYMESVGVFLYDRNYQQLTAPSGFVSALQALSPFEGLNLTATFTLPAPDGHHGTETGMIADVIFVINNHAGGG